MSAETLTPGPGAAPFPPELATRLLGALAGRKGPPRTRHLVAGTARAIYTNRLALEQSPYLLQHAHNPVDWRPWGDEAFAEARARDVPVFLSIGYATCHWCHVMEEESFEDEEIARLLNSQFVCIKIDREERPDVDAIYMQAVQLISGQGGWPMTVFLDHERRPFYAGTYFPPRDGARGSRHGLTTLANELGRLFREERPRTEEAAADLSAAIRKSLLPAPAAELPGVDALVSALGSYQEQFDPRDGGMRRAPKFPSSINNRFLLRMAAHEADVASAEGLKMAWLSLEKMALGGLFDQLGGGFHRYSTDARWLVPHFEKMLYDNGLLTVAYVEAWQTLRELDGAAPDGMPWRAKAAFFKTVAERTLHWMDAEMSDARGGFFSATDADSEGEEGTYFVWKLHEVEAVLGQDGSSDGLAVAKLFDVSPEGNFEGNSVLSLEHVPDAAAQALLDRAIPKLLEVRAKREPPLTDNKVLTAWNGLAISAFARAGFAFHRDDLIARAARAAEAISTVHRDPGGKLLRSSLDGTPRHPALLEDHAFLAAGLVDLFEATGEARWLREALALHAALEKDFADPTGGYFRVSADHEALLAREKPAYDGAEPTGNSVAALTLLRLGLLTGDASFKERAHKLLRSFGATLSGAPLALGEMLLALEHAHSDAKELVLLRPAGASDEHFTAILRGKFLPHVALIRAEEGVSLKEVNALTDLLKERTAVGGQTTAYVCRDGACGLPATTPQAFADELAR
jgi:uncharacterized protein YyaL (SSP411 family)